MQPQFLSDLLHAAVVVSVVICTTILAFAIGVSQNLLSAVFLGAVGYAAGRSGTIRGGGG